MSGILSVKDSLYVTKANNNPAGVGIECETGSMGYFVPTTLTDDRIYGLPNETGTLATREWTTTYAVINRPGNLATSILGAMKSSELPVGMSAFNCQNSTDNPTGSGNIATALICKHNLTGIWSYVWVFTGGGQVWFASISSTLPSSLTWTRKI